MRKKYPVNKRGNSKRKVSNLSNRKKQEIRKQKGKKKRHPSKNQKKRKFDKRHLKKEVFLTLLIFLFLFIIVQQLTFTMPKMVGYSMTNTISDGDRLFVSKFSQLKRFKLIYYRDPESKETSIRRIIGLPGETVRYQKEQLYINNREIVERFLEPILHSLSEETTYTDDFFLQELTGDYQVPVDSYFVLGDNRPFATDSRTFGYIKKKDVIGVVEMRLLPFHLLKRF